MLPVAPFQNNALPIHKKVRRVTTELKRYQVRYPRAAAEAAAAAGTKSVGGNSGEVDNNGGPEGSGYTGQDAADELPPWVTSSEVMSPLLAAYDTRIQVELSALATKGHEDYTQLPPHTRSFRDGMGLTTAVHNSEFYPQTSSRYGVQRSTRVSSYMVKCLDMKLS